MKHPNKMSKKDMFNINKMAYPSTIFRFIALLQEVIQILESLVVIISLGYLRPNWVMPFICWHHCRDLKAKILKQQASTIKAS